MSDNNKDEDLLWKAKRERQAKSRALVESGQRTQASMFFISPEIARNAVVMHRSFDLNFDDENDDDVSIK